MVLGDHVQGEEAELVQVQQHVASMQVMYAVHSSRLYLQGLSRAVYTVYCQ